jgi:hypothetical protein
VVEDSENNVSSEVEFVAVIEAASGGGAWVRLPADALAALGGGHRFRVVGSACGVALESSTMSRGGGIVVVGLHKATRLKAGVCVGDPVTMRLRRDERPREVAVPEDLADALAGDRQAKAVFDKLAFTHRKEYATWVAEAKRPETRARRVAQTLERLCER